FYALFVRLPDGVRGGTRGRCCPTRLDEYGCRNTTAGLKPPVNSTRSLGSGFRDSEPCMWNWMFGAGVVIVLAWSLVLFQIECIPSTGLYSLMFQRVVHGALRHTEAFDMTVGELEFVTYFVSADYGRFQTAVQCLFVAFVIIMRDCADELVGEFFWRFFNGFDRQSEVYSHIGIAVGDIEGITRESRATAAALRRAEGAEEKSETGDEGLREAVQQAEP
uniref:PKD_channel domain-containing protein n=1 Tax=Macrostomum lignano TaxID=282301 RepID=A0A1I8F4P5_9PLAT